ncbi:MULTISPECIES: SCP2 sterol-binding domain-containing protein [Neobacillus]|uniref:SCP2 sterol-binding domain-containing protein n=2 Tax=Neobacillus citreus TaxID=2833578 RepID=A0A9J6MNX2_9BACI|nr:SCP2 sterol-binding domain-containing protein [Neobacillus citreus]MCH6266049.1 SCP2 sterol-binding domain-containing protein [Neobacillus citreus]
MEKAIQEYSLTDLMARIEEIFNENPGPIQGFNAVVQYDVYDQMPSTYQHYFHDGTLTIKEGVQVAPNVTMSLNYDTFKKFVLCKMSGTMALLTGKVKVKGDVSTGLKIESILKKYNLKEPL